MCIYPHGSHVFMIASVNSTFLSRATHYHESWYTINNDYIRYNICNAWFLDIVISTCSVRNCHSCHMDTSSINMRGWLQLKLRPTWHTKRWSKWPRLFGSSDSQLANILPYVAVASQGIYLHFAITHQQLTAVCNQWTGLLDWLSFVFLAFSQI